VTTKQDKAFREVADRYISGPQAKGLCEFLSHSAFLLEHKQREETDGRQVLVAFSKHIKQTMKLINQLKARKQLEETIDDLKQKASKLAGSGR